MPYSITTRDGITINNIPDDLPHDAPELKARVQQMRASGQGAQGAGAPKSEPPTPAVTAPKSGYAMGLRDPIDAGAQLLERLVPDSVAGAVNKANNWLADKTGLVGKVADGPRGASRMVQAVNDAYDANRKQGAQKLSGLVTGQQEEPGFDWGRLAGNVANPVNFIGAGPVLNATRSVPALAMAGAKAGAVGGLAQPVLNNPDDQFWQAKAGQGAMGALAGAVATPALAKGLDATAAGVKRVAQTVSDKLLPKSAAQSGPDAISAAVERVLQAQGMRLEDAPDVILKSVRQQAEEALAAGGKLDPAAAIRKAQFEAVGMTGDAAPTLGQVTRDPMQYANERNLVGVRIKTPNGEGNPLSDRFQAQANALQQVFDSRGAAGATDNHSFGTTMLDALRAADAPVKGAVDDLYAGARSMNNGRAADLERSTFSQAANQSLDEGMLGHALPAEVRNLLNDISSGKTPFNVDAATQIDTILSRAQRKASRAGDDNAAFAVGKVRDALHATPLAGEEATIAQGAGRAADGGMASDAAQIGMTGADRSLPAVRGAGELGQPMAQGAPGAGTAGAAGVADTGANARAAFEQARRAARDRFATIEKTPALKAALDDGAPDKFVQTFILNAPARDVQALKQVLANSPEALAQARAQIADHLKRAAFGNNASGDAGVAADRYLNTLRNLGREKLAVFFTPDELVQFNLAGKVMSDITSIPAGAKGAVNTSGTSGALMNLFSKLSESPTLRQIPFARSVANQVGEIQTERAMNKALSGQAMAAKPGAELSPQALGALRLLFAPGASAAGSLGGSTGQ